MYPSGVYIAQIQNLFLFGQVSHLAELRVGRVKIYIVKILHF